MHVHSVRQVQKGVVDRGTCKSDTSSSSSVECCMQLSAAPDDV